MRWVRVTDYAREHNIRTNLYVKHNQFRSYNSPHLQGFKKEDNKLYIDVDYFNNIISKNKALQNQAQENYYKLLDVYDKEYTLVRAVAKVQGVTNGTINSFVTGSLFLDHKYEFPLTGSKRMVEWVKSTNKMIKELENENKIA